MIRIVRYSTLKKVAEDLDYAGTKVASLQQEVNSWKAAAEQIQKEHTKMAGELTQLANLLMAVLVSARSKTRRVTDADVQRVADQRIEVRHEGTVWKLQVLPRETPA